MAGEAKRILRSASSDSSSASSSARHVTIGCSSSRHARLSLDLVTATRWHLSFLRSLPLASAPLPRSVRRYEELWMPLIAELSVGSTSAPLLLPPPDVHWVWHCHCLAPLSYRGYCASRFGFLIDRPSIFDEENEEYALGRCREIWTARFPSEPFDLQEKEEEKGEEDARDETRSGDLVAALERHRSLGSHFSDPFVCETVYLVSARRRYSAFLQLASGGLADGAGPLVPASDILLMWLTHQSFPGSYWRDTEAMGELGKRVVGFGERADEEAAERTRRTWEEAFDEPYERAGAAIDPASAPARAVLTWDPPDADVNRRYRGLHPRSLLEVCVFFKGKWEETETKNANSKFVRLRTVRCHREFKLDKPVSKLSSAMWQRSGQLFCEFSTRGIVLEIWKPGRSCLRSSKLLKKVVFLWNDLLRATSFTLTNQLELQVRALSSITPPIQAPYLLKCVPDRVTDDSGAMISDEILRRNRFHPQEGRWISRTVLDHAGRECFVIRIRVGTGFWRWRAENPTAVKWEDRIIEVREGPWKYIANSVGYAPEKVVGTATPKRDNSEERNAMWCLSTGDVLTIQWENGLNIHLENDASGESARLLSGRKLQYQVKSAGPNVKIDEEEDQYLTLVRFSLEHPDGRATALINWKLFAMEFLPEEDATLLLLVCMAIVRTISEIRKEDIGGLLLRRRVRQVKIGTHDWGSVMLPSSPRNSSPHIQPWYWNAKEVLAPAQVKDGRELINRYSPADGKEGLYRQAIIP